MQEVVRLFWKVTWAFWTSPMVLLPIMMEYLLFLWDLLRKIPPGVVWLIMNIGKMKLEQRLLKAPIQRMEKLIFTLSKARG